MTNPTIALADLAEKGADVDVLRQMVQFMAQRLMEPDVDGHCDAGCDEKTPEQVNSRSGYRESPKSQHPEPAVVEYPLMAGCRSTHQPLA